MDKRKWRRAIWGAVIGLLLGVFLRGASGSGGCSRAGTGRANGIESFALHTFVPLLVFLSSVHYFLFLCVGNAWTQDQRF